MEEIGIDARVHGRALLEAPADGEAAWLLVGFHGYGERAETMLPRLRLPLDDALIPTAIEALHAFYTRRAPGYSWMTSDRREQRIDENLDYCERALDELRARCRWRRVAWCGFSQGAPMAVRAAKRFGGHALLINGGELPPGEPCDGLPPCLLGRGEADDRYSAADMERDRQRLTDADTRCQAVTTAGGHDWDVAWMEACAGFLDRR